MKKRKGKIGWYKAPDIKKRIISFSEDLGLEWLKTSRIFTYRSFNSSSRAYARTWGFPRIWQMSLKEEPAYIIEVLSEHFDKLSVHDQNKVLLHEIAHIPQNFSGSLLPHIRKGKRSFHSKVESLVSRHLQNSQGKTLRKRSHDSIFEVLKKIL